MSESDDTKRYADLVVWDVRQLPSLQVAILDYGVQIVATGKMHFRICTSTDEEWAIACQLFTPGRLIKAFDVVTVPKH